MRSSMSSIQSLIVTSPPTVEPVALSDVKAHLRITWGDDDNYLQALITRARVWLESRTGRALVTQTLQGVWTLPKSPESQLRGLYAELGQELTFWLPRTPLQTVTLAEIEKDLDVWQTLNLTTDYVVDNDNDPQRVWLRASAISYWAPTGALINFMGVYAPRVRITFTSGYTSNQQQMPYFASDTYAPFLWALLQAVAYLYENREAAMPPDTVLAGLDAVRNI
jgi:uncharacterized phiE125 gp8 family phage protein